MKKGVLGIILLLIAFVALYFRYQQVFQDESQSERNRPKFPEGLSETMKADPFARIRNGSPVRDIYASNGYVYCVGNEALLEAIEIENGSWFGHHSFEYPLAKSAKSIQGVGDMLVVYFESEKPVTLDVSDPAEIIEVKTEISASETNRLIFDDNLILGTGQRGLPVYERKEDSTIREVGFYPSANQLIQRGWIRDRKAYLCAGWRGIHIVDLALPFSPNFETLIPVEDYVIDACLVNHHLVVCRQSKPPLVFDWREGPTREPLFELEEKAGSCVSYGNRVFLGYSRWTYEYDFADPKSPVLKKVYPGFPHQLAFWEDKVLIPKGEEGVWVYRLEGIPNEGS